MIKNSSLNEHDPLIFPSFLCFAVRAQITQFSEIHASFMTCAQLLICMWTCMHLDQPADVCGGRRLQQVKCLCVCRGCLRLCRRPSIMHASALPPQLWCQPWAEVAALYHAAAHFFKAGKRNRVSGKKKEAYNRMGRGDKTASVCVCHIRATDCKPHEPSHSWRRGAAWDRGSWKVNLSLSSPLSVLRGKAAKEQHQQQRRWEKKQEAQAPQELDWLNEALCYLNGKSMFALSKGTRETGSEGERSITGGATIRTH